MAFGGLSTAVSGLFANQRALDVVAHNIANADNADYVRQSVIQKNSWYDTVGVNANGDLDVGTGVDVDAVRQIRDVFLDSKYRKEVVKYGYYTTMQQTYETLSASYNEISNNGLQKAASLLWEKWNAVAGDSQNLTQRGLLKDSAIAYCESVNHLATGLNQFREDTNKLIKTKVNEINEAVKVVADMNDKIMKNEASGDNANDYRDTRNKYIDKLAEDLGIQVTYNDNGSVNVLVSGNAIVSGKDYDQIDITSYPTSNPSDPVEDAKNYGMARLVWHSTKSEFVPGDKCGSLSGLMDTRDKVIPDYKDRLNSMVRKMADDINSIHKTGYGIDIPSTPPGDSTTGLNFFVGSDGTEDSISADTIKFNSALSDLNKIAASESKQTVDADGKIIESNKSDNKIALKIADLRTSPAYIFKEIVSSPITTPVDVTAPNNTFDIIFGGKDYTVTIPPSGGTPYSASTLKDAIITGLQNSQDASGHTIDLTKFIDVQTNGGTQDISIKVNAGYADISSMSINDSNGLFAKMGFSGNTKYDDYYAKTVEAIGQGGMEANTISSGQQTLINQVDNKRKAMSGVSKDEEMTEMLKYQKAYNASARVVTAMDEMLNTIINSLKR